MQLLGLDILVLVQVGLLVIHMGIGFLQRSYKMYKIINNPYGKKNMILRLSDYANIPFALDNTDYQQYLKWLEEGNTPEPADEPSA